MKKPLARIAALLLLTPLITTAQITPPYSTGFESADGFTLGPITSGDWESDSAQIIDTDTALGDQALQLGWNNELVPELNLSIDSTGNIHFVDLHLKPVAGNLDDLPEEFAGTLIGLTALIKDDNLGEIYITRGTGGGSGDWQPTGITLPLTGKTSTDWVRYTYRYNHSAKKWDLYINSQLSAYNIGYIDNSVSALNDFTIFGDTRKSTRLDHYSISTTNPLFDDNDKDGIDDAYETTHGLNTGLDDRESDKDHDWLSNLNEYFLNLAAGDPDTDNDGVSDGRELAQETDPFTADEFDLSTLPFTEDFESYTLGTGIHGQNHWQITGSLAPIVQNSIVQQGTKALQIQGNGTPITIANNYNGSAEQSIWIDLHSKPRRSTHIPELNPTATAAFYFDNDGQLRVKNGNYWNLVIDSQPLEPGAWVRIALHINYTTQQWAIWLDGVLTAHELGFHHTNPYLSQIQIDHNGYHTGYLDNISISDTMPEYLEVPLPEELDQELEIWEDTALAVHLEQLSNSYPAIEYVIVETPDHGTLIGEGAERTYIPDLNYHGEDSFTYKIVRGEEQTETGTIDIQVQPINDAPWVNAGVSQSIVLPATASLDGTVTDVDSSGFDYRWRKVSGPGDVTFADYQDLDTTATFSAAGDYILRLNVDDNIDLRSDTVAIHVAAASSTLPTVSLTAPSNNATYSSPATINLTATASTGSGTVTKVEFFEGTRKLGEDTSSPYAYSWTPVNYGAYALTAVVTDSNGLKAVSSTHTVKVTITKPAELGGGTVTPGSHGNNGAPSIGGGDGSGIPGDPEGHGFLSSILESTQGQEPPGGNGNSGYHIDQDDDGLSDLEEEELGTDKHNEDTDNDGTNDSEDGWALEPALAPERIPVTKYAVVEVASSEATGEYPDLFWRIFLNDNGQVAYEKIETEIIDDLPTESYSCHFWENGTSEKILPINPEGWPMDDYTLNEDDIGMTAVTPNEESITLYGLDNAGNVIGGELITFEFFPYELDYVGQWNGWSEGYFPFTWTSAGGIDFIIDPPDYDPSADDYEDDAPEIPSSSIQDINGNGDIITFYNNAEDGILYKAGYHNGSLLVDYYNYDTNEDIALHDGEVFYPIALNDDGDIVGYKWSDFDPYNPDETVLQLKRDTTYDDLDEEWNYVLEITDRNEEDEFQIFGSSGALGENFSAGFWIVKPGGIETVSVPNEVGDGLGQVLGATKTINNRLQIISNRYEDEESNVIYEAGIWQNYKRYNIADLVSDDRYSGFHLHAINNNGVIAATATFQPEEGDPVDKIVLLVPVEWVTYDLDINKERSAGPSEIISHPVPEVDLKITSAYINSEKKLVVEVNGKVKDQLSELTDEDEDRVQSIHFYVNKIEVSSSSLASSTGGEAHPWRTCQFEPTFSKTITIDEPGTANWIIRAETSENSAEKTGWDEVSVFVRNTIDSEGNSVPVVENKQELEGSRKGFVQPLLWKLRAPDSWFEEDFLQVEANGVEQEMGGFTYSPKKWYMVGNDTNDRPRVFVVTGETLPGGLTQLTPDNINVYDNGEDELEITLLASPGNPIPTANIALMKDEYGAYGEEENSSNEAVTLEVLLTYYKLLYDEKGLKLLSYFWSNPDNKIELKNVLLDKYDVDALGETGITLEIENGEGPVVAAHALWDGLWAASADADDFQQYISLNDLETLQNARAQTGKLAGEIGSAAAKVYSEGLKIATSLTVAGSVIVTFNDASEGDYIAAIAFLPFIPSGSGFIAEETTENVLEFSDEAVTAVRSALKVNRSQGGKLADLRRLVENGTIDESQLRFIIKGIPFEKLSKNRCRALLRADLHRVEGIYPDWMRHLQPEAHHDMPVEFREWFLEHGIDINKAEYGRWAPSQQHDVWHANGFNDEWALFKNNEPPGSPYTLEQIEDEMNRLRGLYPVEEP